MTLQRCERPQSIEELLVDLCINPKVAIRFQEDTAEIMELEDNKVNAQFPELRDVEIQPASLPYFRDVSGALLEYKRRREAEVRAGFALTGIARKIWDTLDFGLKTRSLVLVDGLRGAGRRGRQRHGPRCIWPTPGMLA